MEPKPIEWVGASLEELRAFPAGARRRAGYELRRVQMGLDPLDWRAMPLVGPGVREIRIHLGVEHRVIYLATLPDAVYVLRAFGKKTQRTSRADLEITRHRYGSVRTIRTRPTPERPG